MEENSESQLILSVDEVLKSNIVGIAKWAKFLAIVGFVFTGFIVLFGIFSRAIFSSISRMGGETIFSGALTFLTIFYLIVAIIYFIPYLFLYRFSSYSLMAMDSMDRDKLNNGFRQLRMFFSYMGILTLIGVIFMVLSFITILAAGGMMAKMV